MAWVSSEKDDAITLIDMRTLAVAGTVPTCKRPRHMQVAPGDDAAVGGVLANRTPPTSSTWRRASRCAACRWATIRKPSTSRPTARRCTSRWKTTAALGIVDAASGKLLKTVPVGKEPEGVKTSPDGKRVYVTSEVASLVHVIDTASAKVIKNITVGKRPRRFAISADGTQLWVTNELGASVSIISTQDLSVIGTVKFELKGMRASDITPVGIAMSAATASAPSSAWAAPTMSPSSTSPAAR